MGPLVKGATALIGLGTEAYAHHKQKKERSKSPAPHSSSPMHSEQNDSIYGGNPAPFPQGTLAPPPAYPGGRQRSNSSGSNISDLSAYGSDGDEWARDAAQEQLLTTESSGEIRTVDQLVDDFTRRHPPPQYYTDSGRLPCPVIIPQKRPESKTQGFIRAYAPALNDCGIDQATFLDFLDNYTKSIKGGGYFHAVNIAIATSVIAYTIASASINPAVHFAAFAVHTSIEGGRRLHNTSQINKYLDRMNEELFKPHGLYAMLMTYKPNSDDADLTVDVNTNVLKSVYARDGGDRSKFRTASGKTHGDAELPESAPLIFPALEAADPEQKKNAFKRAGAFIGDYQDRKARAQFEYNNPNSALNVGPKPEFSSIFADPNHSIHKGGPLNLLTGGYLNKGRQKITEKGGSGTTTVLPIRTRRQAGRDGGGVGGAKSGIKRLIGEDVIYLMVVNMPSESELKEVAQWEEQMKKAQHSQQWGQQQAQHAHQQSGYI